MTDQNLVYGIDVHSRSLTAFPAEENRTIFLISSYTLKNDSKVFLLEADDRWSRINGNGYNFDRKIGEILHMDAHPQIKKLIFAECSFRLEEGKPTSSASICELDESSKVVKTLSCFIPKDPSLKLLRTEFQPNGDRLALLGENGITICDVKNGGNELKECWSHNLPNKSAMNSLTWDNHSPNGNGLYATSGSDLFFFDTRTEKEDLIFNNGFHRISAIACNPLSTNRIAVGSEEGRMAIWDTRKSDKPVTFKFDHQYRIWDLKYNHTYEQLLISCASDGRVILYNLENAEKEGKIESELITEAEDSVYCCAWAGSDPFIFATVGYDGRLTASKVKKSLKYKLLQGK